jgi:gamma-glutamyltranspeptidase/glutathione hydrolase
MNFKQAARPVVMGRNGMVSAGHHLAAAAGVKVLQEGGNAIDAALAAAFVMAVVKPDASGPGGDLFALVFIKKTGKVEALNSSGPAPAKASIEYFRGRGLKSVPTSGPLSIAVPGAVDGWIELHKKYGTKDLSRVTADAIAFARQGFPIHLDLSEAIEEFSPEFPSIDHRYRKPLGEPKPGKLLLQKGLSDVIEKIAQKGRDGFYAGEIAERICQSLKLEGGILAPEDLESSSAQWLEPLSSGYREYVVFEQPPVSQGFMVLEMLNILEAWPLNGRGMSREEIIHCQVEAKKLAFEDRIRYLEDPRFGDPRISMLISKEYAAKRRQLVGETNRLQQQKLASMGGDTTYLCATDRDGNAVSLIQSIFAPFGSRVIAGDTGVIMNNRLCSFGLDPAKTNSLMPGKRPAHTLNTYMVFRGGELFGVGGSPGADEQPQTNLQVLHNLLDLEMDPQAAVEAPRWSHQPGTPPRDQMPEALRMEEGFEPKVMAGLRKKGHDVSIVDRWSFGSAKVIIQDRETGTWMAGADPRRQGYALGW